MRGIWTIFKRELRGYTSTATAYVFLTAFLFAANLWTFRSGFFDMNEASLRLFFTNMPILFVLFAPAFAMRLWSEERRSHTIELLFSLPITVAQAVLGKFLAAWCVVTLGLALTFPMVITVYYLGHPDPGPIITGYLASFLLAGAFLSIGNFFSALTRSQVIAFVLAVVACGACLWVGQPSVLRFFAGALPAGAANLGEIISFQYRFDSLLRGVLAVRDLAFFLIVIVGWLVASVYLLKERKAA